MKCVLLATAVLIGSVSSTFADKPWGDSDRTREIIDLKERVDVLESADPVPGPPGPAGPAGVDGEDPPAEEEEESEFPWMIVVGAVIGMVGGLAYGWKKQG